MLFKRNGKLITASTKAKAISKIVASDIPNKVIADDSNFLVYVRNAIEEYGNNADLNYIDVSKVTSMNGIFGINPNFNGDISQWDVSKVETMEDMFAYSKFNGDISKWNVSKVTTMEGMFYKSKFNGNLNNWNVSNVENMGYMFKGSPLEYNPPKWYRG